MKSIHPSSIKLPTVNKRLTLPEVRTIVESVRSNSHVDTWQSRQSTSGYSFKPDRADDKFLEISRSGGTLPAYSVYTISAGYPFSEEDPTAIGITASNDDSKVFVTNGSYELAGGNQSREYIIDIHQPHLVNYDVTGGDPAILEEVGVPSGSLKVKRSYKGLLVVSEPDTVNHRVWVIRHYGGEDEGLFIVEPKDTALYPHNVGAADGVTGYIHQWDQTTCAYVKNTSTEIKIFDPTGQNLVLPKETVFARKKTQYCIEDDELIAKERYEIIGSHGLFRKTKVPKVSSGDQRLKVAECGEQETVNIVNTVPGTYTLDINIVHGPHNPLFELDEPLAYYDLQETKFYIAPYDPPEVAFAVSDDDNCGELDVTISSAPLYMDRFDIACEGTDLRSNSWPIKNPYSIAFGSGDPLELRRDLINEEYVVIQSKVKVKDILSSVTVDGCSVGFVTDKIYGYNCNEEPGSAGISFTAVEAITAIGLDSCSLEYETTTFCALNVASGAGGSISGSTATFVSGVSTNVNVETGDCNLVFTKKSACVLGSITNLSDDVIDFVQQTVVTSVSEILTYDESDPPELISDCIVITTDQVSVLCIKGDPQENELFCFTECEETPPAMMMAAEQPESSKPDISKILIEYLKQVSEKTGIALPGELKNLL